MLDETLFKSQHGQDRYVYERFFKERDRLGTFFEAGMVGGVDISNTYFFEKALGWTGICVEANPYYAHFAKARPGSKCFQVALGEKEEEVLFLGAEYIGGILKFMDAKHIDRIEKGYAQKKEKLQLSWVRSTSIMNIFAEAGMSEIDFFSLDIEGGEMAVLKTIDFGKVRINVAAIEVQSWTVKPIVDFMTASGFDLADTVGSDRIFVNRNFQ